MDNITIPVPDTDEKEFLEITYLGKRRFKIHSFPDYLTIVPDCGNVIYLEIHRPEDR